MWIADGWKDYEVIDCSGGEKLERWGKYILVRPDPQVIWDTDKKAPQWRKMNGHYHRSSKGGGEWEFFSLPEQWSINYKELTFQLSFPGTGGKLGLVWRKDQKCGTPGQSFKPLRLHRRSNTGSRESRSFRDPC